MSAKFSILRVVGEGEQINVEVNVPAKQLEAGPEAVHHWLRRAVYEPLDIRLSENSRRILDAMGYAKNLPQEAQIAVKQVIDMIYGRAQALPPVPKEVLEADAQAVEAEKARLAAEGVELEPQQADNVIEGPWAKPEDDGEEPA